MEYVSQTQLLEFMRKQVRSIHKRQCCWADHLNVSASYVSQVMRGDRPPSDVMLADLGIELAYRIKEPA